MKLNEVLSFVKTYSIEYRNPNLPDFEISQIYDLFPERNSFDENINWPAEYFHNGRYGIYLILNIEYDVIYIGKAKNIGKRLGAYFGTNKEDKTCLIKHTNWSSNPKYLCTIAVDDEIWFEALSLEEYLIWNTQPIDNKLSKNF
ncbi:GIY-YIG nuclease family protein [Elizabethkingia sp. HX CGY]|uniref:GIY-YIG catalytic domain-containing protein n=1 Tax=Epilithonimonas bovis DSM 19482 TaxID=1121284 RepID=A0A1U7Q1J7_9FLAO|nr:MULTISPECIES: GIY-YIG nuclease family protein [Weeksellaceae]MDX8558684.1 GIY-YIG nuclease family protein [Elizabethkingia sp. HX CGY]SIT99060.1 GIY-YIG catalytic domain-containing protein [Epilithonimonas bovis DSM 19482]